MTGTECTFWLCSLERGERAEDRHGKGLNRVGGHVRRRVDPPRSLTLAGNPVLPCDGSGGLASTVLSARILCPVGIPSTFLEHHGAVSGIDSFREVSRIVVVGRQAPAPSAVQACAEALTGAAGTRLPPGSGTSASVLSRLAPR